MGLHGALEEVSKGITWVGFGGFKSRVTWVEDPVVASGILGMIDLR